MRGFFKIIIIIFFSYNISNLVNANEKEIEKINKQLESIKSLFEANAMDKDEYDKIKQRLINKKENLKKPKKSKSSEDSKKSATLKKQIEVLEKLLKDGVLSQEEFEKSKEFLETKESKGENIDLEKIKEESSTAFDYELIYPKDPGRKNWEKTVLIFKNYKIYPYRPGGIKVVRKSDDKLLYRITDNFKEKYYNEGKKNITTESTFYKPPQPSIADLEKEFKKSIKDLAEQLKDPFGFKKKKPVWDKEAHKLKLFIDGIKVLTFEGRYVKKHKAYFYQVLTPRHEAFHYYIKLKGKSAIALNMEIFNVKIDKAIRKAKKKLAEEYDVTEEEIQKIIDKKIGEEIDRSIDREMENAINESVSEAIEQSIGEAMSQGIFDAIEQATGEAIDQALENELANHIDQEIERAIQDGLEEAAVAAGFQAYYDTLLAGGSVEEALKNASDACGAGCEFVLDE